MERLSLEEQGKEKGDEELLALSVQHPSLFALLVRKYEDAFLRKALSIVRGQEEAEDVVQEAFTKIYLNAAKFKTVEGAQFSSWGYRILINTALTHYAKVKKGQGREAKFDDEIWALIPDKNLKQFEKKELVDLVASVLSRMPKPLAKALSSFFIDGKTQEEIAHEEGLSVGAVKTRVHRAKAEFKKVYETINTK
ncbi:MAG TPA: sigma-70 family RNA polymerase sigma factor [Candidatus Paceibacterota bacterium]|jgi:RNA polymerase sigma-70 factor (ECF subfamily)|nr:sigma-70 family RNA polymerase sigma factor [Candidatus Paceibacterota bacterium]